MSDVLIECENVGKKFCRDLKKSLWYGVKDSASDLFAFGKNRSSGRSSADYALSSDVASLRPSEFWANEDVSFSVKRGECIGLIGHNGAGKTTLLKMLNGLIKPDKGSIKMKGKVRALIALGAGFSPILTGRENIYINASVLGKARREIDEAIGEIIAFSELGEFIDAPVRSYSSGMSVRLGFAIAVASCPDILLLDEVLAVGDIGFQAKCFNALSNYRAKGTGFILVSHNMHQIARYCDHVIYMKSGRVEFAGEAQVGIERFIQDMDAGKSDPGNSSAEWAKVYGSGKVAITSACFLDHAGVEIDEISPGDTFSLAIDFQVREILSSSVYLDLQVRDSDGVFFQGSSKDMGFVFEIAKERGRFVVTFESVPANRPELRFFFSVLTTDAHEILDWKRNLVLKVNRNALLTGRCALTTHWTLSE